MKIDLVINNMIQQADRTTQTQMQPQTLYRTGEVLQGHVMGPGTEDGSVQIRLNSGVLLNAVPAEGIQLLGGATVTLRVSAQSGPKTVMQLLSQEVDNRAASAAVTLAQLQAQGAQLLRLGAENTPMNRGLLAMMNAMGVPAQADVLARAADAVARFPALPRDRAVFLAANGIAATQKNLATLGRLLDGQDMAIQLQALAASLQVDGQAAVAAPPTMGTLPAPVPQTVAAQQPAMSALLALNAQAAAQAAGTPPAQAQPLQNLVAQNPATQAVEGYNNNIYDTQHDMGADSGSMSGRRGSMALFAERQAQAAASPAPEMAFPGRATEALQLQSLLALALGDDGTQYAQLMETLQSTGLLGETVSRALEGMFQGSGNVAVQARAYAALLPGDAQDQGEHFFAALVQGLREELTRMEGPQSAPTHAVDARTLAAEVARLIVGLRDGEDGGARLLQAAAQRRATVEHLAIQAQTSGPQDAAQQLRGIAENLKMVADINQYAYQQIPVTLGETPRTVDLYVMKRGKGHRIDPDNASILIALNTDHMGRLETLIHVNHHSLRLRVGVVSAEIGEYIEGYTRDWGDAMEAIGYRLADLRMQVTEYPVTPLSAQAAAAPPSSGGALNITL